MNSKKTIKNRNNKNGKKNNNTQQNDKTKRFFIYKTMKNNKKMSDNLDNLDKETHNEIKKQEGGIFDYDMIKKALSYKNSLLILSSVLLTADIYNKFNGNNSIVILIIKLLNKLRKYFYDHPTTSFTISFLYMLTFIDKDLLVQAIQTSIDAFTNFIKNTTSNNINAIGFSLIIVIYSILNISAIKDIHKLYLKKYDIINKIIRGWNELIISIKNKNFLYLNTGMSVIATIATIDVMLSITDKVVGHILDNVNKKDNINTSLNFIENINKTKLQSNSIIEALYKNTCVLGTFLQRGTWNTIKTSNDAMNYSILNLKLYHFDIPFNTMFSSVSNPNLRVNIGLTPVMISIFMMVNILSQDVRHELIDTYNQYISDLFVLVSKNKHKISCLPSPSQLSSTIKNNKHTVIIFYENNGYENVYVLNKICKIINDIDKTNYGWNINFVQVNRTDDSLIYKKHGISKTPFISLYNDGQISKEFKYNNILVEQSTTFNSKDDKKFDTIFISELLKKDEKSKKNNKLIKKADGMLLSARNKRDENELTISYNIMDSTIKNLQFNMYSMFVGAIENSIFDTFNIINYSNTTNFHKNKKELEIYLQNNEKVLLYLYDNDSSCNIKPCNIKQEEKEMNFLLNYDKKSRENIMFLKYNNLETINSLLEFYKLSTLTELDDVKFVCCHLDAYKDLDIHMYSYEKHIDTLSLFVKNKKHHDFTNFTPLTSHPNFELYLKKIVYDLKDK
jgi:hypothetical protein